jgi:CheY-like chemotaxis protein
MSVSKVSVLIAEDETAVRVSLSQILVLVGYQVRSAADGLAALIEIEKQIPDILISDLNMPHMSGFELLSVVRARFPAVKVIAMSGAFGGDQIPEGVNADGFYQKGLGVRVLLSALAMLPSRQARSSGMPETLMAEGLSCLSFETP